MQKEFLNNRKKELEKKIAFRNNGFQCSALRQLRDYGAENNIRMSMDKKQSMEFESEKNDIGKSFD